VSAGTRTGRMGTVSAHRRVLLCLLGLALGAPSAGWGQSFPANGTPVYPAGTPAARGVAWIGLTVSDMDRSIAFYRGVLSFEVESDREVAGPDLERLTGVFGARARIVRLRLGEEELELTEYLATSLPGRPAPVDSRSNDGWFQHVAIIVSDMDRAYRVLRSNKVRSASTEPQLLPRTIPNAAGIRAFYFRDPDAHPLEILQFPPDKGDAKWHRPTGRLFLGIDHTAIVVSDTERSLRFYQALLGLQVKGESHNFGTEQAHLNNVEGADLRITGLRGQVGPGIEFLEYLSPRDGRPIPTDERPNDLVHWQTTIVTRGLASVEPELDSAGVPVVSRGVTDMPGRNLGFARGVLVRDPDGHVLELIDQ
jgi:catechol 2,3-dioxygenase-like lactoylglutathione lyase family enzyme